ncbi:MAG: thiamine diphosphokinase [Clostridia bacterium]|nr:thiamine diphosphokinase [Clostridia bacterium]MDD7482639.1 thiamine diphosphokinase [Clostridia bacterium]
MEQEVTYCTIIGAAPLGDSRLLLQAAERGDFLICADGGLDTARRLGVTPHLILGDFDSLQGEIPDGEDVIRLPVEKDDTDMLHAVKVGLQHGYRSFLLLGGLGGERPDHSMANFCVLRYLAEHGAQGVLTDGRTAVRYFLPGTHGLEGKKGELVSVFPFGCLSCTVSYTGLYYETHHTVLTLADAMGVSNCMTGERASITVHEGQALVFTQRGEKES